MRSVFNCLVTAALVCLLAIPAHATKPRIAPTEEGGHPVDVVIALDVSGSMSGLIESAKQRLWDIVNELAQADPQPDLRLAIVTYGNPAYGAQSGFVRVDMPFTRDLDAVMQTLFSFGTNGGDEYVARAIHTSVGDLDWSTSPNAMKILFVAGNEGAEQDPLISVPQATRAAINKGIVVNTLYCGSEGDNIVAGWQNVANLTNGLFASIDQNAAAVANIATPMDEELAQLNQALNDTYVAYGVEGRLAKENQIEQDANAADMSLPSVASRTVAKAGALYRNERWDLVDAQNAGKDLEEIDVESLPAEMQAMDADARRQYVAELGRKRESISRDIQLLAEKRQDYIVAERERLAESGDKGLDAAMIEGLRGLAEKKGFEFD
jgi:hypothetical protein